MITRRILVRGRVQGVSYRWWTLDQARALGLKGWVRNRRDGSVEILAHGPNDAVAELAKRCRSGPPAARVSDVVVGESEEAASNRFDQKPTM